MRSHLFVITTLGILVLVAGTWALANDPIKWSAPMTHYPNAWTPTPEPPSYYNPYGYRYPYAGYGYGPYDYYGYGAAGAYPQGYQGYMRSPRQGNYYGNPYGYY